MSHHLWGPTLLPFDPVAEIEPDLAHWPPPCAAFAPQQLSCHLLLRHPLVPHRQCELRESHSQQDTPRDPKRRSLELSQLCPPLCP